MATIKNTDDIAKVRRAAQTAAGILDYLTPHIKAGITTGEIDRLTREACFV
ncbi:type I methionyl aminopeptidase [Oligella ureolytica]